MHRIEFLGHELRLFQKGRSKSFPIIAHLLLSYTENQEAVFVDYKTRIQLNETEFRTYKTRYQKDMDTWFLMDDCSELFAAF